MAFNDAKTDKCKFKIATNLPCDILNLEKPVALHVTRHNKNNKHSCELVKIIIINNIREAKANER